MPNRLRSQRRPANVIAGLGSRAGQKTNSVMMFNFAKGGRTTLVLMAVTLLPACTPIFPQTAKDFEARVEASFYPGMRYADVETNLTRAGYRLAAHSNDGFEFTTASGPLSCGQIVAGELDENGRVTKVWGYQGCFRTLVP